MSEAAATEAPKRQVAKREPKAVAIQSEPESFLQVIERAARDPAVDVAKMERLVAMQEKMIQRAAEEAFNNAMAEAQVEMQPVRADASNPQTKSRYASYAALDRAVRPIYSKHGFALSFNTEEGAPADYIRVVCYVSRGGFTRKYQADMPADGKGAKGGDVMTKTHAVGSGMTYAQRYLLKLIFNMAIGEGSDDDGNAAGNATITEEQTAELLKLIETVGADIRRFCEIFKVDGVALLPARRFEEAKKRLDQYGKQKATA